MFRGQRRQRQKKKNKLAASENNLAKQETVHLLRAPFLSPKLASGANASFSPLSSAQLSSIQLEPPRHLLLEHLRRIILAANLLHPLEALGAITPKHLLIREGIVQEDIRIVQPPRLSQLIHLLVRLLDERVHVGVVLGQVPPPAHVHPQLGARLERLRAAAGFRRGVDHGFGDGLRDQDLGAAVDAFHLLALLGAEAHDVAVGGGVVEVEAAEAVAEAGDDLRGPDGDEVEEVGVGFAVVGDGGDAVEGVEGFGAGGDGAEVDEGDEEGAVGGDEVGDHGGSGVELALALVLGKGVGNGVELAGVPGTEATPDGAHGVRFGGDVGGDAEVVLAGFHGPPEIAVGCRIGVDEAAIGEDHLCPSVSCVFFKSLDGVIPRN